MKSIRFRHWAVAVSAAVLTHIGLGGVFNRPSVPSAGAKATGLNGVEIALAPAGSAPGEVRAQPGPTDTLAERRPRPDIAQPPPPATNPESLVEPEARARTQRDAGSVPADRPEAETRPVDPVAPPRPERQAKSTPTATPEPVAPSAPVSPLTTAPRAPSPPPGASGKSGAQDRPQSGAADTLGGGATGARQDYFALLSAWLERYKHYPSRAQRRRQEGTVLLRFVVDRNGKVLSYRIERTSGHVLLDREVEKLIRRAAPLPAMPEELTLSRLELVVPVSFAMR